MRLPKINGEPDLDHICKMVDSFMGSGGTYYDAAYAYGGAEEAMRESVVKRYPRESFQIATKFPMWSVGPDTKNEHFFNTSLQRLGTDYVDFYLLHGINAGSSSRAEEFGVWDYFAKLKSKGMIRHMGFSFHGHPKDLDEILTKHPETEFVMMQLNYDDWDKPKVNARRMYEIAREHDIPVVAMEPLLGGKLASENSPIAELLRAENPDASVASWALRFTAQLEGVFVTLSGMSALDQMSDNVKTFSDIKPLSKKEMAAIKNAVEALRSVPRIECTSCNYCKDCPADINIASLIDLYNDYLIHKTEANLQGSYGWRIGSRGRARDCTACKACEEICPQNLEIIDVINKVSKMFD